MMKLLECTNCKKTKDENDEKLTHLESTEVIVVHCIIVNDGYQQDSRVLCTFTPKNQLVKY